MLKRFIYSCLIMFGLAFVIFPQGIEEYYVGEFQAINGFSILGWSKDGKIALAAIREGSNAAGPFAYYEIEIIDLITDIRIESFVRSKDLYKSFDDFFTDPASKMLDLLKKYKIIPAKDIGFEDANNMRSKSGFSVEASCSFDDNENYIKEEILLTNNQNKRKICAQRIAVYDRYEIIGYSKSPYENRIVILVKNIAIAGPNINEWSYAIIGSHLQVGF